MANKEAIETYQALIPHNILLDLDLSANEIRLYGLIETMHHNTGCVFYSNAGIAEILKVKARSIQRMTEKLKNKGYISKYFDKQKNKHLWIPVKGDAQRRGVKGDAQRHGGVTSGVVEGVTFSVTHNISTTIKLNTINKWDSLSLKDKKNLHQEYLQDIAYMEKKNKPSDGNKFGDWLAKIFDFI